MKAALTALFGTALVLGQLVAAGSGKMALTVGFMLNMGAFFGFKDQTIEFFKVRFGIGPQAYGLFLSAESGAKVLWQLGFSLFLGRRCCVGSVREERRNRRIIVSTSIAAAAAYAAYVCVPALWI